MSTETLDEFRARLNKLASGALQTEIRKIAIGTALVGEGKAKELATTRMRVRSRRLRGSIKGEVRGRTDSVQVVISAGRARGGKPVPYAAAQERGATIRPVRGRYLAIPLAGGPAVTPAGVPRYTSPRAVAGLVPWRSRTGRLLLVRFTASGVQPWYLLHPGPIRIRPKRFVRDGARAAESYMVPRLSRLLGDALQSP